jgi:hypothetical protein
MITVLWRGCYLVNLEINCVPAADSPFVRWNYMLHMATAEVLWVLVVEQVEACLL